MAGRRWRMRGMERRGKSGIWYSRLRIPDNLYAKQAELNALGVEVGGQYQSRSLGTCDQDKAETAFAKRKEDWKVKMRLWQTSLDKGHANLTKLEIAALVGHRTSDLLRNLDDEVSRISVDKQHLVFFMGWTLDRLKRNGHFQIYMGDPATDLIDELAKQDVSQWPLCLDEMSVSNEGHYGMLSLLDTARFVLNHMFASEILRSALRQTGPLTDNSKAMLRAKAKEFATKLDRSLKDRAEGDYSLPDWIGKLPPTNKVPNPYAKTKFEDVLSWRAEQAAMGLASMKMGESTKSQWERWAKDFTKFSGVTYVSEVTKQHGEKWRSSLLNDPQHKGMPNNRKTVKNKLSGLRKMLTNAQEMSEGKLFSEGNPWKHLRMPEAVSIDPDFKSYSDDEVRILLRAAREEQLPLIRWGAWVMAYSGMRIGEFTQIRHEDLEHYNGRWYLYLRHDGSAGRNIKTGHSRVVPIHRALENEGFVRYLQSLPEGKAIRSAGKGNNLKAEATLHKDFGQWVHKKIPNLGTHKGPAHAFRHWVENSMGGSNTAAAEAVTGRAHKGSRAGYLGAKTMWPSLAEALDQIPELEL